MNRIVAVINLCITGFYTFNTVRHMIRPGWNVGYTRMLLFACLATIPLVFLLMMVGGKDRWPMLLSQAREMAGGGPLMVLLLVALAFLLVIMPVGMLVAVWFSMGLRFGSLFILYFVPVILRLAFGTTQDSVLTAITQGVTFFVSFLLGIAVVSILNKYFGGAQTYQDHLQVLWPGYSDAAKVFFAICIFAIINQLLELRHAAASLLARW